MEIVNKLLLRNILVTSLTIMMLILPVLGWVPSAAAAEPVGNWQDYADSQWLDANSPRYQSYTAAPGSDQQHPYLITSAAELAQLSVVGGTGELAGKYLKLDDCHEIDLSAHYWTPVNFYGGDTGSVFLDQVAAHFDGSHVPIKGLKIKDTYREAKHLVFSETYGNGCGDGALMPGEPGYLEHCEFKNGFTNGAAAGFFGEIYKAQLHNFKLVSPQIEITQQTDICSTLVGLADGYSAVATGDSCESEMYQQGYYGKNLRRIEMVGSLVGAARYSMISDSHVLNPDLRIDIEPINLMVGGLVGYSSGFNYITTASSAGGQIAVTPRSNLANFYNNCTDDQAWAHCIDHMHLHNGYYSHYQSGLSITIGGLVGSNYHGAIMNGFSSTHIKYDTTKVWDVLQDIIDQAKDYPTVKTISLSGTWASSGSGLFIGGLVGYSNDARGIAACILNSYSLSDIDLAIVDGQQYPLPLNLDYSQLSYVEMSQVATGFDHATVGLGGIAGYLFDTAVNNYYDGHIRINGREGDALEFRQYGTPSDNGHHDFALTKYADDVPTAGFLRSTREFAYYSSDNRLSLSKNTHDSVVAVGKLFGVTGAAKLDSGRLGPLISRETCDRGSGSQAYDVICLGLNDVFLKGITYTDHSGDTVTLHNYTVNDNYYRTDDGVNLPPMPTSGSWKQGYDDPAHHFAGFADRGALLASLNQGLPLVAQMVETDLGILSSDPATRAALIELGRSLISDWVMADGQPTLRALTIDHTPDCGETNPDLPGSTPGSPTSGLPGDATTSASPVGLPVAVIAAVAALSAVALVARRVTKRPRVKR